MASSNTLITPTIIAREALRALENNLVMGANIYREYKNEFKKVGTAISLRKPNKFRATKAQARSNTNLAESSDTFTVATQAHVSWAFSSVELTMTIENYKRRYITPAAEALANTVDVDLLSLYDDIPNQVGTPGTTPATFGALGDAGQRLDEESCPQSNRKIVFNPAANWSMADALKGTFDQGLANSTIRKGMLGRVANFEIFMDQNVQTHTTGIHTTSSTPLVAGASQSGTSLATDGWAVSTAILKAGDVFTLADVYAVNYTSGDSTGVLRQFVSTTDVSSDGSGLATIVITPGITASGAYQTVSAAPANNAAITVVGTESTGYSQNLAFHPEAFGLVTMPLEMPANTWGRREVHKGVSIRVLKQYDIDADEEIIRMDILYGVKTLNPALACRITG